MTPEQFFALQLNKENNYGAVLARNMYLWK